VRQTNETIANRSETMLPIQRTPQTLDEAVRQFLHHVLPPHSVSDVAVDVGVAIMTDYIRNKMASDVFRYESMGHELMKICSKLTEVKK